MKQIVITLGPRPDRDYSKVGKQFDYSLTFQKEK